MSCIHVKELQFVNGHYIHDIKYGYYLPGCCGIITSFYAYGVVGTPSKCTVVGMSDAVYEINLDFCIPLRFIPISNFGVVRS